MHEREALVVARVVTLRALEAAGDRAKRVLEDVEQLSARLAWLEEREAAASDGMVDAVLRVVAEGGQ